MKCSLGISNFFEEISSFSHSIVFFYLFALVTEEGFLISPCSSLELCIHMGISFLFSFAFQFNSVQLLSRVSFQPHELQHARLPSLSPTPRVYPNSCPLSWWCCPTISSSVIPFSFCPQSFPASMSFHESALHIRWPKYWNFSFNVSPSDEYPGLTSFRMDWFRSYLNCLVVSPSFFSLSLNLAIRSAWSEPQSAPGLVLLTV